MMNKIDKISVQQKSRKSLFDNQIFTSKALFMFNTTSVVCKRTFDDKRRGRTKNQVRSHEKINYINGGKQV